MTLTLDIACNLPPHDLDFEVRSHSWKYSFVDYNVNHLTYVVTFNVYL